MHHKKKLQSAGKSGKKIGKNYKHGPKRNTNFRKPNPTNQNEKFKKFKAIRRAQESDEILRRQKEAEIANIRRNEAPRSSSDEEEQIEEDPLNQLLGSLQKSDRSAGERRKNVAIESSDSDDTDSEMEDDENEDHVEDERADDSDAELSENDVKKAKIDTEAVDPEESSSESEFSDDGLIDKALVPGKQKVLEPMLSDSEPDDEIDDENLEEKLANEPNDMFSMHLDNSLSPELLECVSTTYNVKSHVLNWPILERIQVDIPTIDSDKIDAGNKSKKLTLLDDTESYAIEGVPPKLVDSTDMNAVFVKGQIQRHIIEANKLHLGDANPKRFLTDLQAEIFSIASNYQDIYVPQRTLQNGEEIRFVYCLHALNHILRTRTKILQHNAKLAKANEKDATSTIVPDTFRDQGMFRPKVLIMVPFKDSALRVVNTLIALTFPELGGKVMNHKRFLEEFTGDSLYFPKRNPKPEDYEQIFAGNSDDMFRLGICITRKCLKLYTNFYSSDILIASPLGMRTIVGAPGEKDRDYDFLASIELLILDQADIFLAQNWDHVLHVLDHMHLQPQSTRNTDFSRVRTWCLNGWSRFYRQTMLFTTHEMPEFRSLFNSRCGNYRGKVKLINPIASGSMRHVAVPIAQVFHRIDVSSIQSSFDQRFNHFVNIILPQCKGPLMAHCLIYVPSYFDYVRIRNYFKKENLSFVQICEYTKVTITKLK